MGLAIVQQLNSAVNEGLESADAKARLTAMPYDQLQRTSPEGFASLLAANIQTLGAIMRTAGIKAD